MPRNSPFSPDFSAVPPHSPPLFFSPRLLVSLGEALKIFQGPGGSELERDFTYIDDIVQGCVASLDRLPASTKDTAHFKAR